MCANTLPLLKKSNSQEWAWAPPLGFALAPSPLQSPGGGGRERKSGVGTELPLTLPRLPSPHTRPDSWNQRGDTQRERRFWGLFVGVFVLVIIFLTLGAKGCGCVCGAPLAVSLSSQGSTSLLLRGTAQQR